MGFLWFGRKKEAEEKAKRQLHDEVKDSIHSMRQEFSNAGKWIEHLHGKDNKHEESFAAVNGRLDELEGDIDEIKEMISFFGPKLFKQRQTPVYKQTSVDYVQTPVRTGVYNEFFSDLTTMERAIAWVLINTDMKLSCEDIAALLGKSKSTIRGQLNTIKQKSKGIVQEVLESNGKKRVFIPEEFKGVLLKKMKIVKKKGRDK